MSSFWLLDIQSPFYVFYRVVLKTDIAAHVRDSGDTFFFSIFISQILQWVENMNV